MSVTERIVDTNDVKGTFHIVKNQDCEGIIKVLHELNDHVPVKRSTQVTRRLVGTVPNIVAVQWAKEWGVRLYSREWAEKVHKRLKTDPNWVALRAPQQHRY